MVIERLDLNIVSAINQVAAIYCRIWQEPPWNEYFWTANRVIADIKHELTYPNAACFVSYGKYGVKGFSWGYEVDEEMLANITGHDKLNHLCNNKQVFYIDELGVDPRYRGWREGRKLSETLIAHAVEVGCSFILLRTDIQAEAAQALYRNLGFKRLTVADNNYPNRLYWLLAA